MKSKASSAELQLVIKRSLPSLHACIPGSCLGQAEVLLPYQTKEVVAVVSGRDCSFPSRTSPWKPCTDVDHLILAEFYKTPHQTEAMSSPGSVHLSPFGLFLGSACEHLYLQTSHQLETVMTSHGEQKKTGNDQEITQLQVLIADKHINVWHKPHLQTTVVLHGLHSVTFSFFNV